MAEDSIDQVQHQIIEDFQFLGDDKESIIFYIMELGQGLPALPDEHRIEQNIIKGCQSKVWLITKFEDGRVFFVADSNTEITKGLISLLIRVLSGRTPDEIIDVDLYFVEKIGMSQVIGSQRSNGFVAMIKQMKLFALAYKSKIEIKAN